MNIGFDAKRAFHNRTGLGYYSRTLIGLLSSYYPQHEYYLFNPRRSHHFDLAGAHIHEIRPRQLLHKLLSAAWRSSWVKKDLARCRIDLYHGLSHEIPAGIQHTATKSVVTIHDLIHERYPGQYNPIDVKIYHKKFLNACTHADRVIAISRQTKNDIMEFYKVPGEKIDVCYQSCDPVFGQTVGEEEKKRIAARYRLPSKFFLYVGSVIERKNLLNICKAMFLLRNELDIPLVVIGEGARYRKQVGDYILQNGLEQRIIFLSERDPARDDPEFRKPAVFAAIYQSAIAMVYPSFFEGFGAPVLEALWSGLPVITSRSSCLPEVAGDAAYYVDPAKAEEIAEGMKRLYSDEDLAHRLKEKGREQALHFSPAKYVKHMMEIYESVCHTR